MYWIMRRMGMAHGGGPLSEGEGGGGGGTSSGTMTQAQVEAAIQRLQDRNNTDPSGVATLLFRENHELREERRTLRDEVQDLRKNAPKDGGLVLSKEEAEAWKQYTELGKPDEVKKGLEERESLKADVAQRERRDGIRSAASLVNFKPNVLIDLVENKGLHLETRDVDMEVEGKTETVKVPFVRRVGDDGKPTGDAVKLTDYVQKELPDYMPALQQSGQPQGAGGTVLPKQSGGGQGTTTGDKVGDFVKSQQESSKKVADPLAPQTT